ncbi:hypothetical protein [Gracilinema caldarium]|uniref:Uncharacterized protein n=1 Tax=Gracilinema caldarium (strain ATCC 51460 / DSM 7334 / H1) TaxID=744872 RepID=F8F0W9_GRAC1|nr:hypothetical protein [Gracilinema caldarium]AEJ20255.1 hypothetical protein Spica_2132 [Gracilinema caldarium DSM 7334]
MIEMHKANDLYLKQGQDWVRESKQENQTQTSADQDHSWFILRMVLYLFNR